MNACELAKYLEIAFYEDEDIEKAANMLRQQADRIDKLEREAVAKNNYLEQHCQKIDQQADRIAELEKQLKHYKMAWNMAENTLETQTKPLNDAIKIVEHLRIDADMIYKDYENTYADGWDDAFNEILTALHKKAGD